MYTVYGRWSHKLKQTQTHAWSLVGEEAVAYSLARGKAAAVTRESGEVYSGVLSGAREKATAALGPRRAAPKPLLSRSSCLQPA